jgi:hypothetical protein
LDRGGFEVISVPNDEEIAGGYAAESFDWLGIFKVGRRWLTLRPVPVTGNAHDSRGIVYATDDSIRWQDKLPNVWICKFANDCTGSRKRRENFCLLNQSVSQLFGRFGTIRTDV